jgi:hypothetical protein
MGKGRKFGDFWSFLFNVPGGKKSSTFVCLRQRLKCNNYGYTKKYGKIIMIKTISKSPGGIE